MEKKLELSKFNFRKDHEDLCNFLASKFSFGYTWEKYLIHMLKIIEQNAENRITSSELRDSLGLKEDTRPHFSKKDYPIIQLIENGYIQKIKGQGTTPSTFSLTEKGLEAAKKILNRLKEEFNDFNIE